MVEGRLLVDKPGGMTSHDVVQVVRRKLGIRRIGHTGTLDPMARGLLILLVGSATKYQQAFQAHPKTYEAILQLGMQTDTADATGTPIRSAPIPAFERASLIDLLASFEGPLSQTPPIYSAIKVQGRPAYWWTRRHQPVILAPRKILITEMTLVGYTRDTITVRVGCSAGTYIRTLAESIAERLGTVGCLASLVRLRIGPWRLEDAQPLSAIQQESADGLARHVVPVTRPLVA